MNPNSLPDNPYLLLTPGPLSTTKSVKQVMLQDWCTWDDDYNQIVRSIREELVRLATSAPGYTSVLMQGSGSFGVEATLISAIPTNGKLLILTNGAYGDRMAEIAVRCSIDHTVLAFDEKTPVDTFKLESALRQDTCITHLAVVHCETTTGILNPISEIGKIAQAYGKTYIVDAMSSFGGIPMDIAVMNADYLISSSNKCIQGVPGFSFVISPVSVLRSLKGQARSLCLDLYDQWEVMEKKSGKWRFTSPTHTVRAFAQALKELEDEGGVFKRNKRYSSNQSLLVRGMADLGFKPLLKKACMSPIITSFLFPETDKFEFRKFYEKLKKKGFVIYPGKITKRDTFRIGTIGNVYPQDIEQLLQAIKECRYWI